MLADGDSRGEFVMGGDPGSVLLACQLDCETQPEYNLTIAVSNGVHTVLTQVTRFKQHAALEYTGICIVK